VKGFGIYRSRVRTSAMTPEIALAAAVAGLAIAGGVAFGLAKSGLDATWAEDRDANPGAAELEVVAQRFRQDNDPVLRHRIGGHRRQDDQPGG